MWICCFYCVKHFVCMKRAIRIKSDDKALLPMSMEVSVELQVTNEPIYHDGAGPGC